MLTKRIIPCLDIRNGRVVKGVQFQGHRDMGDPAALAQYYSAQGADELVFYDITASPEARAIDLAWVARVANEISIPFSVAGGIRSVDMAKQTFDTGADKVSINTPAQEDPSLIDALARTYGSQAVVVSIDLKGHNIFSNTGDPGKTRRSGRTALSWIREVVSRGAGELVINSMVKDGVRDGYDLDMLAKITDMVNIPVIASGGAGQCEHFREVFEKTNVSGALAASIFHSKTVTIPALKSYLEEYNIPVRITK